MSEDVPDAISILACALRLRESGDEDIVTAIERLDGVRSHVLPPIVVSTN